MHFLPVRHHLERNRHGSSIMKIMLILLFIACLLVLSGYLLPATRQGTSTRMFEAPPAVVRSIVLDIASQPRWRSGIAAVEPAPGGAWTEIKSDGERIRLRVIEEREQAIVFGFESTRAYTGRWNAQITPSSAGGTALTVTEEATTPSPLGRILSRLFFDPDSFSRTYLDELAAEATRRITEAD